MYLCTDTVISLYRGRFYARCAKNSSLYREYRYIEDRYIGILSHTFYCNFCRDIAYLSLYRGYRYIEDRCIGVPQYHRITRKNSAYWHINTSGLFSNTRLIQVPGCRVTRSADHLSLVFTPEKNSWPGSKFTGNFALTSFI